MSLDTNICGAYCSQFDANFHNQLYEVDIHCWFLKTGVGTPHESVEWSNHGVKRISERVILWLTGQRHRAVATATRLQKWQQYGSLMSYPVHLHLMCTESWFSTLGYRATKIRAINWGL
jgi:hypothetical protein